MKIEGTWRFPFVEMELKLSDGKLAGTGKKEMQESLSGFGSPLFGGGRKPTTRTEMFQFSGIVIGTTCKYEIGKRITSQGSTAMLSDLAPSTTSGYIVFHKNGTSGEVAEFKKEKLASYYTVEKAL